MTLDVAYSYCTNLTEEEKLEIDKQVRKNRFELEFYIKISSWNGPIFTGWKPTYIDIKSPLDPEVIRIRARGEPYQSLEDQVDNILKTISLQRQRAINNNESVIHIITLLRIKPSDRAYFMNNFKTKALKQNLDLNGVKFMNTSSDMI